MFPQPRIPSYDIHAKPRVMIYNSSGTCIGAFHDITFSVAAYGHITITHANGWVGYSVEQVKSFSYEDNLLTIVLKG